MIEQLMNRPLPKPLLDRGEAIRHVDPVQPPFSLINRGATYGGGMSTPPVTRRRFLGLTAAARMLSGQASTAHAAGEVPYRALGRTGERVSAIGLGGYHLGKPDLPESESLRIIRTALD